MQKVVRRQYQAHHRIISYKTQIILKLRQNTLGKEGCKHLFYFPRDLENQILKMLYACNLINCKGSAGPVLKIPLFKQDDDEILQWQIDSMYPMIKS